MAVKNKVLQKDIYKYMRASGTRKLTSKGVSVYDLVCEALAKDGRIKPDGMTSRQWVIKNGLFIEEVAKKSPSKKKRSSTKKTAVQQSATEEFVASKAFLESYAWRKLRMEALKLHGTRCQCCGASPRDGAVMHVDHIKPRRKFPELALEISNCQVLCHECNHGKGNWDTTDWRNA